LNTPSPLPAWLQIVRGAYKNGATKPFDEKVRVAQKMIEMIKADPHSEPSIRVHWPKQQRYLGVLQARL
jgi:hypothetical protein